MQRASPSIQPAVTSVSELRTTTSPWTAPSARFAAPTKPWFTGLVSTVA